MRRPVNSSFRRKKKKAVFSLLTPWVTGIIAANLVGLFLTWSMPEFIAEHARLVPAFVPAKPWTLLTYMFLHAGLWHFLFNMIGLVIFGPALERRWGGKKFSIFYVVGGIGGAAGGFIMNLYVPIIGASGAIFAVMLGFARLWPHVKLYFWGVLPVKARTLVVVLGGLSLISGVAGAADGVAHFSHIGGLIAGWIAFEFMEQRWQIPFLGRKGEEDRRDRFRQI